MKINPGGIVKDKRSIMGMPLTELSRLTKVSDSHLCDIENNRRTPSDKVTDSICKALRLDKRYMSAVFGRVPDDARKALIACDFERAGRLIMKLGSRG